MGHIGHPNIPDTHGDIAASKLETRDYVDILVVINYGSWGIFGFLSGMGNFGVLVIMTTDTTAVSVRFLD